MDTNQQPKAAYLAQELKAGKWSPNILQNEVALRQCAAEELLRLQAENETLRKTDTAARGTDAQIIKERELCAYAFAGAIADGLSGGTGPDTQESEWLRPAFEAGKEIAKLRAEIELLRKCKCLHQIAEPAPVVAQTEALVRYCPGCGSVGTVEGKYRDCCPDGNEARMIPQALAKKCHDTFKIAIDGLLAQPQEAAPVAQAVPAEARQLHGDARLAHDQCRAVVSLANSVAEVYAARAAIVEHDNSLANQIGQASAAAMEWLGDELNASDAATEEDEWLDPIFDAAQERWPQYAQAALAAVAVPTKVIEALEMLENGALNVAINAKNRGDGYDEGYANAMAKMARETLDALAAAPASAPVVLPEPIRDDTYTRRMIEALHENGDPVSVDAAEELERLRALLATATGLPAQAARTWSCPVRTVADLANNLLTMDQTLPIYGAQYIEHPAGRRRAIAVPPTVSIERVKDSRWIGEGDELNAAIIWTQAEQPAAPQAQADAWGAVTQAVRDYHFALDTRQHGGVAAGKALDAIQQAIGLKWVQGAEASARAAIAAAQRTAAQKDE